MYDVAREAFGKGQMREALAKVDEALDIDGDNADAALLGSIVLLAFCAKDETSTDCRFDQAEKYARRAIASNPQLRDAKNTLGVILVHEKKYDDAIGVLKPLAEDILYASPEKSWGNLGWAYLEKGMATEAIDALRRSVAAQPAFCTGNLHLGMAYEKKGDLIAAREALTRALETERPGCDRLQEAYELRGRILAKQGSRDQAQADFQKCRDVGPLSPVGKRCEAELRALPPSSAPPAPSAAPAPASSAAPAQGSASPLETTH
jgi:Tfp pilus assembly protein PilF